MKPLKNFRQLTLGRYFLGGINGFLFASLIYFYLEDRYEKELFEVLAAYVKNKACITNNSEENLLLQSLHLTYYLENNRAGVFNNQKIDAFKASVICPVTYDLITANGACASYAFVLSRLLTELKISSRIAQMKVGDRFGGHILVEAKTSKGWVVLDPSYNLYFKKYDSSLASFIDVEKHWDLYSSQVPDNYDFRYKYEGVRYTNWNKVPIVMPIIKNILYLFMDKEKVTNISLRSIFLRKFHVLFVVSAFIYMLPIIFVIHKYIGRKPKSIMNSLKSCQRFMKRYSAHTNGHPHHKLHPRMGETLQGNGALNKDNKWVDEEAHDTQIDPDVRR